MWHQFYQNPLNKLLAGVLCALAYSSSLCAQGIFENFKALNSISKENYEIQVKTLQSKDFSFQDVEDINSINLNPGFLNHLEMNTPDRYFYLGKRDKCTYYDLILSDILQGPNGTIDLIIFDYQTNKKEIKTAIAKKVEFTQNVIQKQCPGSIKLSKYFDGTNIRNTLTNIKLKQPKNISECREILNSFQEDVKSPYICSLTELIGRLSQNKIKLRNLPKANYRKRAPIEREIKLANSLRKILKPDAEKYISQLCENVNNAEKFCDTYFSDDFWSREHNDKESSILSSFCLKSSSKNCLKHFTQNSYCHFPKTKENTNSLKPWPSCDILSKAQSHSRLFQRYRDCPAQVGNHEVVSWARVLNHFNPKMKNENNCEINSTAPVANFTENVSDFNQWKVYVCYDDKIKRENICYPTLLNNSEQFDSLSLATNIGKILQRLRGYNYKNKACKVITAEEYKPTLLEYKNGCIIIKDQDKCWGVDCAFKVILDETEFKLYSFKSEIDFEVLPSSYLNESKSMKKIAEKADKRIFKKILNVSALKNVLKVHSKAIVYGVGCKEDILPTFFKRTYINQCEPLSFIADGVISENGSHSIVVRTALDHIHAPRIIPWIYLFSGIKSYQKLHPVNTWGFYAIY